MNLFRSIVLIKKEDENNEEKNTKNYELAIVLQNLENEVLVAQLGEDTLNTQNRFVLRARHYTKLQKDVTFQNAIYTVPKENVIESLFKINFEILQVFIDKMHAEYLLPMDDRDYEIFLDFLESCNKRAIKDGSVIITKVNNNYETYFVSKKKEPETKVDDLIQKPVIEEKEEPIVPTITPTKPKIELPKTIDLPKLNSNREENKNTNIVFSSLENDIPSYNKNTENRM